MESRSWSLNELYESFSSEAFIEDFEALEKSVDAYDAFVDGLYHDNAKKFLIEYLTFKKINTVRFEKLFAFSNLSFSVDTGNKEALKYMDKLKKIQSDFTSADVRFEKWLSEIDHLEELIASDKLLNEHKYLLNRIKIKQQYKLSEKEEILLSKLRQTGSSSWSTLQDQVLSQLDVPVEINGQVKEMPLPAVRNLAYKDDPEVRKNAYEAELAAYEKMAIVSSSALNSIKGEVLEVSELRGFESPLDESIFKSRLSRKALDAMLSAMEDSLVDFRRYFLRKAKLLGHDQLPFYDLFAPVGDIGTEFSYDEARDFIVDKFTTFSKTLGDYAQNAFDNDWIDPFPKKGKRGGAFCYNLQSIKESRILSNFTGSLSDVMTLAHELGHGYHGYALKEESILNSDYPMPLAETASIFCETIVKNAILKDATKEEKIAIIESSLQDSSQVIVDIYSRFLFESSLFDKRKEYALSVDEMKDLMLDAQEKAYSNSLSESAMHPYMWMCKPHYYSAGFNFYNYPYAFGLLFALGLYNIYLDEGDAFIEKYNELLKLTGKEDVVEVTKSIGIDIESKSFWEGSLAQVKEQIKEFITLTN